MVDPMRWWLFFHLLAATCGVGFALFQIFLAGRVKQLKGTPEEAPVMKAHLAIARKGMYFLIALLVTGLAMWGMNDYGAMGGSKAWLHVKLTNVVVLFVLLFAVSMSNGKKIMMALAQPGTAVTEDLRSAYRKSVMALHIAMLLILANVILGYWKPGS